MNFNKLKEVLDILVSDYNTPGVDCAVYRDHQELFRYYTGVSDVEKDTPMRGDELYIIFSMTKMLTCTCVLQLIERGKLSLDDEVVRYLPEFGRMQLSAEGISTDEADKITRGLATSKEENGSSGCFAKTPITIRHLMTMTAGLDYNLKSASILEALEQGQTSTRDLIKAIAKTPLGFEPGSRFRYSLCHDVLGAVIEVISGMRFGEYMQENIFRPLGMKDTFFGVPKEEEKLVRFAKQYSLNEKKERRLEKLECHFNLSDDYESGGAGLVSSIEDYALFLDAMACGGMGKNGSRILRPESISMMGTNQLSGQALEDFHSVRVGYGYGLGVRVHMDPTASGSLSSIGEFGWDGAAGGFSMVDPKNKLSLTYFQEVHGWKYEIQNMLRNALYESLLDESSK